MKEDPQSRETMKDEDEAQLPTETVETILSLMGQQLKHKPQWVERYFPEVANRGYATYEDVDGLNQRQAEALRWLLLDQIAYGRKQMGMKPAILLEKDSASGPWPIKVAMFEEAFEDLVRTFRLSASALAR